MYADLSIFYILAAVTAISALAILWVKNILHAALLLILCLLSIAGIFALHNAEFLAVTQIMVYAGGILVLILFGIMITVRITGKVPDVGTRNQWIGLATCAVFFLLIAYSIKETHFPFVFNEEPNSVQSTGIGLILDFAAPFELSGLLLLVSLVSASLAASYHQKHE